MTHQPYPKYRHRLASPHEARSCGLLRSSCGRIESKQVTDIYEEQRHTPDRDGWVDLARDLFDVVEAPVRRVNTARRDIIRATGPVSSD